MRKLLTILVFICHFINAHAQPQTVEETIHKYSIAQKRLLVLSTAAFTNLITQNNLDRDSVILVACRVTGLPFLIAYEEDYDSLASETQLINAGKIPQAARSLNSLRGEKRARLLSELAIWYLYKAGTHKMDLDTANYYIRNALASIGSANNNLRYRCLALLGEYYRQSGNEPESKNIFLQIISTSKQEGDKKTTADAWHRLGKMHNTIDSTDLTYLNNSLALYQSLQLKEKEIELLRDIGEYHFKNDLNMLMTDLVKMLNLQDSIGYKHSLFVENLIAFILLQQSKYAEALNHANIALENLKWSGLLEAQGNFYQRIGAIYHSLGKKEEAITWFKKAIEHGTQETRVFWYKSLFFLVPTLVEVNRVQEALSILQNVTHKFPPLTLWEKGQVFTSMAHCCQKLNNDQLVEENYSSFLKLITENPDMDPYGEFTDDYKDMIDFYLAKQNVKKARFIAEIGLVKRKSLKTDVLNNYILFKIDSVAGDHKSALDHHIKYKFYDDAQKEMEQGIAFEELTLKYDAEKKDNDIKLLHKEKELQGAMLLRARNTRNWILGGVALLLIIVGLLVHNSRLKQRTNKKLQAQGIEIEGQNIQLRHLVNEKDWLVKEIHHRVKNNLQTVMGLLGTQTGYLKNEVAIRAITDSQRRIRAMSLIHQRLYQSNNLSAIKMTDYIRELVDSLSDSFDSGTHVRFTLEIESIKLDLAHCIPLGLILNEAITNSFKYAFPTQEGAIWIFLKRNGQNSFVMTIKDNGSGLPSGFDSTRSDTMGMNLMRGLSAEIGGEFVLTSESGTNIEISFVYDQEIVDEIAEVKTETSIQYERENTHR